jgi:toxin ParE1/3/4
MALAQIHTRAAAGRDLVEHYVYLGEQAGIDTAERFLLQAYESFRDLAAHPYMGGELAVRRPKLTGIRKWQVKGFEKFLIFYLPRADGVSIVRVLHAAQDWWSLLGIV